MLQENERSVSPVIGVILMVAITVIIAAIIATFTLGLTNDLGTPAPQGTFTTNANQSHITVTYTTGDAIPTTNLDITGHGIATGSWQRYTNNSYDTVTAGRTIHVPRHTTDALIRVVWSSNGQSSILHEHNVDE